MFKYTLFAIIVLMAGCGNNKAVPDVSNIKTNVQIERFEQDFFRIDTLRLAESLMTLEKKYPDFFPVFMQNILQINATDEAAGPVLKNILAAYAPINDSIQEKYKNFSWLKDELDQSFRYVKHYYPAYNIPKVITFVATLDAPGAVITQQHLGIGLQQFGGKAFSVYQDPQVQQMYPYYIARRFDKEYITANTMKAVADDIYGDETAGLPLIEQMIEKGKQWFLLDKFLPNKPDSVKTGYTQKQLDWLSENEGNAWAYITKAENIYSIEPHVIQTYIGEAPFTQGMTESSPGNIGQWIGWRMVQKFAAEKPKLSLQQVLQTPARTIFEESKYRPK